MKSDRYLLSWFCSYNKKYFGNRLPETLICWSIMKPNSDGDTPIGRQLRPCKIRYRVVGKKWTIFKNDRPTILISNDLRTRNWESIARWTLLHEMCHLALPIKLVHGPRFHKEMLRLAKRGAFKGLW